MGMEKQQGRLDALLSGGWNTEDFPTRLTCLTKCRRDRMPLIVSQCHSGPTSLPTSACIRMCSEDSIEGVGGGGGDMDHREAWLGEKREKWHTQKISTFQYFSLE